MAYLLDSDWLIDHLANDQAAHTLLAQLASQRMAISIITYLEVFQGTLRAPDPISAQDKLNAFVTTAPILPISIGVAQRCAHIREHLRQHGRRVQQRAMDLLIAATAIEYNLTLVTRNSNDYQDIPGLVLY